MSAGTRLDVVDVCRTLVAANCENPPGEERVVRLVEHMPAGAGFTHPLAAAFTTARHAEGLPSAETPFTGGSDARFFGAAGVPAVVFGPGSLEQAHAPDEFVPVAELRLAARLLTYVVLDLLTDHRKLRGATG